MNILYKGFIGTAGLGWGWVFLIGAVVIFSIGIYFYLERDITPIYFGVVTAVCIIAIILSIFTLMDNRIPIIKATVDDTIPWKEVVKNYKMLDNEGDIYTFKVLNTTKKEWERHLNEQH